MMTCRELIDFLHDFVENALPPEERRAFEKHLSICPDCQNYVASYKLTIELERAAMSRSDDEALPEIPHDLVRAILASRSKMKT